MNDQDTNTKSSDGAISSLSEDLLQLQLPNKEEQNPKVDEPDKIELLRQKSPLEIERIERFQARLSAYNRGLDLSRKRHIEMFSPMQLQEKQNPEVDEPDEIFHNSILSLQFQEKQNPKVDEPDKIKLPRQKSPLEIERIERFQARLSAYSRHVEKRHTEMFSQLKF